MVWQGDYPTARQEYKLLQEATELTHGAFVIGNTERKYATDTNYVQVSGKANVSTQNKQKKKIFGCLLYVNIFRSL